MKDKNKEISQECAWRCHNDYQACISSKEHESVCRMKQAQCQCGCS